MSGTMSRRDRLIGTIAGIVVMYAIAAGMWFMSQAQAWKTAEKKYAAQVKTTQKEKKLISEREKWNSAYEEEREKMPVFATDAKDVDTHWLGRMDSIAQERHVSISRRQADRQVQAGDVFELPIDVKDWEASLSSLVKFMHALEDEKEAMFDIRELTIRPSSHKGFLKGSFKLACAYMRGEEE